MNVRTVVERGKIEELLGERGPKANHAVRHRDLTAFLNQTTTLASGAAGSLIAGLPATSPALDDQLTQMVEDAAAAAAAAEALAALTASAATAAAAALSQHADLVSGFQGTLAAAFEAVGSEIDSIEQSLQSEIGNVYANLEADYLTSAGVGQAVAATQEILEAQISGVNVSGVGFQKTTLVPSDAAAGAAVTVSDAPAVGGQASSILIVEGATGRTFTGQTNGAAVIIPPERHLLFAGQRIKIGVLAKQAPSNTATKFGIAYACGDGNSGYIAASQNLTPSLAWHFFHYHVPASGVAGPGFVSIFGDHSKTGKGTQVAKVFVEIAAVVADIETLPELSATVTAIKGLDLNALDGTALGVLLDELEVSAGGNSSFISDATAAFASQGEAVARLDRTLAVTSAGDALFFDTFDGDVSNWQKYSGDGEVSAISSLAGVGGKVLQVGNNTGNDQARLIHEHLIPFDPNKKYKITARARQVSGTGQAYFGFAGVAADGVTLVSINGANSSASQHYHAKKGGVLAASFSNYEGYTQGRGESAGVDTVGTVAAPSVVHPNVAYLRPLMLLNYSGAAGQAEVVSFKVEDVTVIDTLSARVTTTEAAIVDQNGAAAVLRQAVSASLMGSTRVPILLENFTGSQSGQWNTLSTIDTHSTYGPRCSIVPTADPESSGYDFVADGYVVAGTIHAFAVDPARKYRIRVRARRDDTATSSPLFYCGFSSMDNSFATVGSNKYTAASALTIAQFPISANFSEFTSGVITGTGTGTNQFTSGTTQIRLKLLLNYSVGTTGDIIRFSTLELIDVTDGERLTSAEAQAGATATAFANHQGYVGTYAIGASVPGGGASLRLTARATLNGTTAASDVEIHSDNFVFRGSLATFVSGLSVTGAFTAAGLAVFGNTLKSSNYDANTTGWQIENDGSAEFNGVVLSRQLEISTGTFTLPTPISCGNRSTLGDTATYYIETTTLSSAWAGSKMTMSALVGREGSNGSASALNANISSQPTNIQWGWSAEVVPVTRWSGNQRIWLKVTLHTRLVDQLADFVLRWRLYKVT